MNALDLGEKVAIVTGSSSGIGQAVVALMQERGAKVFGFDLPEVDLAATDTLAGHVAAVAKAAGRIDILINNAGTTTLGTLLECTREEIERVITINLTGPMLLTKAVLPYMLENKSGAIVNVASDQALVGKRQSAIYGVSKAAIAQLVKSASVDFSAAGIRFNAIAPGSTLTPMLHQVFANLHARDSARYPSSDPDFYAKSSTLGRFAEPREIAEAIVFLASPAASFITGVVLPVDGGVTAE